MDEMNPQCNLNTYPYESMDVPTMDPQTTISITEPTQPSDTPKPPKPPPPLGPPNKKARTQMHKGDGDKEVDSRLRSEAWGHFTIVKGSDPMRATCDHCGKNYAGNPSSNGTSNFFKHLKKCVKVPWKQQKGQTQITDYPTASSKINRVTELDVNYLRDGLARMVIIDEEPFSVVEKEGFKLFVGRCVPAFKLPSRMTVARDCMKLYIEERKKLKKVLKDRRVCLTTDTWTSLQNLNYMVLTAHYIDDDWVLQKKILNFCTIESHKGAMIASRLEDCLHGWGIDKILTLTVDNASSNDLCIQELLKDFKFKDVLLNNEFLHVRCSAHVLNLVVRDGLKEYSSSIVRVRNACKYVKASPARLGMFKKCVRKEKIELSHSVILDVDTRWNSTYLMLERAEKFEAAFDRLYKSDRLFQDFFDCYESVCDDAGFAFGRKKEKKIIGPPKKVDWVVARDFVTFLKLFYNVTLKFSSTLHVTANTCIPELCKVKQSIDSKLKTESSTSSMFRMASNMSSKYDKYWANWSNINHFLFVAVVLDPRLKLQGLDVCLRLLYGSGCKTKKDDVQNHLNDLFMHYSMQPSQSSLVVPSSSPKKSGDVMDFESEDIYSMMKREIGESEKNVSGNELSSYLSEALENGDINVLGWWKSNSSKYPILSRIAKDILAIPVSTVASEQAFSTSGRVIDAYRSSLNPTTVEALICTQNWIRGTPTLEQLVKAFDEAEEYENIAQESSNSCNREEEDDDEDDD